MPYRKRKKPHRGIGTAVGAMCPIAPNALWALDFQFDTTVDGRTLKLLNIVDEYTRECPAIVVDRSIDADKVVATLDRLMLDQGRAGLRPLRQRPRVHRPRRRRLVPVQRRRHRSSSTPARPGRTPGSSPSTAGSATSSSTAGSSTTSSKPRCSSRTGASTTTSTDPTAPTATSPPASSPRPGPPDTNQHSHSRLDHSPGTPHRQELDDLGLPGQRVPR